MQTFLPYRSFRESAAALDNKRLGKQRVECYQILKALHDKEYGWQNHPAVKMWRGYENKLVEYGLAICKEWKSRGFNDTCYDKIFGFVRSGGNPEPPFLGDLRFHRSHQSNLIRKNPEYYSSKWPLITADLPYFWPTKELECYQ